MTDWPNLWSKWPDAISTASDRDYRAARNDGKVRSMSVVEQFVGRQDQLAALRDLLAQAQHSRGSTLLITGDAGTGKTHLLRRAMQEFGEEFTVLSASCAASNATPFGPWRALLDQVRRLPAPSPLGPVIGSPSVPSTPREFADRLLALWAASAGPVLVMLDDADHLDESSLQVFEHLQRHVEHEPLVMLLASRHEVMNPHRRSLLQHASLFTASLQGLSVDEVSELLLRHDPTSPVEVRRCAAHRLIEECHGHPLAMTTRLRRIQRNVAPGDVLETLLAESPSPPRSVHEWVRHAVEVLPDEHRQVLSMWVLAPTLTRSEFCDATATARHHLDDAVTSAAHAGLVDSPWTAAYEISVTVREVLEVMLSPSVRAHTHLSLGRYIVEHHPSAIIEAARHVEQAARAAPVDEAGGTPIETTVIDMVQDVVDLLDRAGELALSLSANVEAERLLRLADDLAPTSEGRARRLLLRSRAARVRGSLAEAQDLARRAANLARQTQDVELFAEAVVALTIPADWRVGNVETQALLEAALAAQPSPPWQVKLRAALALQRFQMPLSNEERHRWAWQFHPDAAGTLASDALGQARRLDDDEALVSALVAWRSIHREPSRLAERRECSSEALSIALRRRDTSAMVQSAVQVAVDELESANRDGFEHAAVVARWAADHVGNPLLLWRAHLLEATRALLDADLDALQRAKADATRTGRLADALGREATELALDRHILTLSNGWPVVAAMKPDDDWPLVHHPLGIAGAAEAMSLAGRVESARRLLSRLRWPAAAHASMLLVSTLAARAAVLSNDVTTAKAVFPTLRQFAGHVAVDSEAIWVDGPVALAAAEVAAFLEDHDEARRLRSLAAEVNRGLDCFRTAAALAGDRRPGTASIVLPDREHAVLRLLADGLGNAQIAQALKFSVSTIRRETSSLYHRLGVSNRAGAVARAHELGLL